MNDLRDVDFGQYISSDPPAYVEIDNELLHIRAQLNAGENLLQFGKKGIGKTISFERVAREEEIPYIPFDCTKDIKRSQLVAQTTFGIDSDGDKQVEFIPGALTKGILAANEYGQAMVVLEEINALSPNLQKLVNRATDDSDALEISKAGGMLSLDPDAKLMVGATMNPSSISGGTFELNDDLRSRFGELERDFPGSRKMEKILEVNGVPEKIGEVSGIRSQIDSFVQAMKSQSDNQKISYEYSPRDACRLGTMWDRYYDIVRDMADTPSNESREALRYVLETCVVGKYRDRSEQQIVSESIEDSFGVSV